MTWLLEGNLAGLCLRNQRAVFGIYRHNRRVPLQGSCKVDNPTVTLLPGGSTGGPSNRLSAGVSTLKTAVPIRSISWG
jgi:hypothetical protein